MAQRSARRGRDNQRNPECFQHATGVMDPARELPYRPAADHRRIRGRTDGSIRLRATTILKFSLAWEGVSTDGFRAFPIGVVVGASAPIRDVRTQRDGHYIRE